MHDMVRVAPRQRAPLRNRRESVGEWNAVVIEHDPGDRAVAGEHAGGVEADRSGPVGARVAALLGGGQKVFQCVQVVRSLAVTRQYRPREAYNELRSESLPMGMPSARLPNLFSMRRIAARMPSQSDSSSTPIRSGCHGPSPYGLGAGL